MLDSINNNMYMKKNSKRMAVMMLVAAAAATSKMKIKCFSSAFVTPSTSSLIVHSIGRRSISSFGLQNGSTSRGRRSAITATAISASKHQHRALLNSLLGKHHKNPSSWTAAGRTGNFNMNSFAVYSSSCHFPTARSSLPPL
jgi:hypothetical protein